MTDEMENISSRATSVDIPTDVGARLREARKQAGMSIADVAQRIKISPRQIETLENNHFDELGWAFSRGFVRSYARLLNLDPDALVHALPRTATDDSKLSVHHEHIALEKSHSWFRLTFILAALLILFLAPWVAYHWLSATDVDILRHNLRHAQLAPVTPTDTPIATSTSASANNVPANAPANIITPPNTMVISDTSSTKAPSATTQAATKESATPAPTGAEKNQHLELQFSGDSWVEIRDAQGHNLIAKMYHAGDMASLDSTSRLSLIIGNAAQVHLTDNHQPIDLAPHTAVKVARLTLP
jgi:cytoskeleton protein RodZ